MSATEVTGAQFAPGDTVDFAIVGSGAAGGVVARELARAGFRVVVLEQGPYFTQADFHHDEVDVFLNYKLAVNPDTPFTAAEPFLRECDLFLVMSVHPGFGGQKFIPDVVSKIRDARSLAGDDLIISVDGGIGRSTIAQCAQAGCDIFVAGSSVFDEPCYTAAIAELQQIARGTRSGC